MKIKKSRIQNPWTIMLMVVGALVWVLSCGDVATAGTYAESAHGDPSNGVNRSTATCENWPGGECVTGSCAHCHDTFDPAICGVKQLMLFYDPYIDKCDLFCYRCHSGLTGAEQPVTNYPYCVTFGGGTAFYRNIRKQFCSSYSLYVNCGSKHHLWQIREVIKNDPDWGFSADPSPCVACHPPHAAQRNHPVADVSGGGKLNTAIRRPSHYKSTDPQDFLWGDDDNRLGEPERMDEYALSVGGTYQAPYYGDTSGTKFEPSGNASPSDGSDLPNYVTFCMDCHQNAQIDPERNNATVKAIKWGPPWSTVDEADRHGAYPANDCYGRYGEGSLRAPYINSANSNYVLSCLDCHEPHGTNRRRHLLRRFINGEPTDTAECSGADMISICGRCHSSSFGHGTGAPFGYACLNSGCHGHGVLWRTACPETSCCDKPMF